jgi:hypothetical protein
MHEVPSMPLDCGVGKDSKATLDELIKMSLDVEADETVEDDPDLKPEMAGGLTGGATGAGHGGGGRAKPQHHPPLESQLPPPQYACWLPLVLVSEMPYIITIITYHHPCLLQQLSHLE